MFKRAHRAAEMREKHVLAYADVCDIMSQENQERWRELVLRWERNPDHAKNPYESSVQPLTLASIKLQLVKEDAQLALQGNQLATIMKRISPMSLIVQGLELEELHWTSLQAVYMPIAALLHSESIVPEGSSGVTKIPLFLPTAVWDAQQECDPRLVDIEWRLRHAACSDELEKMRKHLLSRNWVKNFKASYGHGQRQGSRSATALDSLNSKVEACATRYRNHRDILKAWSSALAKNDASKKELRSLNADDIRELHTAGLEALGEGDRQLSWIWHVQRVDISDNEHLVDRPEHCDGKKNVSLYKRRMYGTLQWEGQQWLE
ncbi:hypothetical protein BDP27DRAFT_1368918 [Rhodocollybia butyracea]|uniref:Uncharacterized protein n=1 Tax=Rhodocollybia butyracea TaxID=206335 RepID=A0A9P5PFN3_9AGAR|nr:hypothetical protein BDP27DRAFT_1368918 [Rhodocollybia butyracea]